MKKEKFNMKIELERYIYIKRKREKERMREGESIVQTACSKWQTVKAVVVEEESFDCVFIFFLLFTIIAGINVCES